MGGIILSQTQTITASQGGTITLSDASSITIPPGALTSTQSVTLSEVSTLDQQPIDRRRERVGPALTLALSQPNSARSTTQNGVANFSTVASGDITFVLNMGTNAIPTLEGSIPIADIVNSLGQHTFIGISGTYDSVQKSATFSLDYSLILVAKKERML